MGYLLVDHRALSEGVMEWDTVSCRHCQAIMKIVRRQSEGYWCQQCFGPICAWCASKGVCEPFLKRVEEYLARARLRDQIDQLRG